MEFELFLFVIMFKLLKFYLKPIKNKSRIFFSKIDVDMSDLKHIPEFSKFTVDLMSVSCQISGSTRNLSKCEEKVNTEAATGGVP